MVRKLEEIAEEFEEIKDQPSSQRRTQMLVGLMNELEKDYGTLRISHSAKLLEDVFKKEPSVKLYRDISLSRS